MDIERKIYNELLNKDSSEAQQLRSKLFGNNEWSSVDEADWVQSTSEKYRYHEDMGS